MRLEELSDDTVANVQAWYLGANADGDPFHQTAQLVRDRLGRSFEYAGNAETLQFSLRRHGGPAFGRLNVTLRRDNTRTYVAIPRWGDFAQERRAIVYRRKGGYLLRAKHRANTLFLEILLNKQKKTRSSVDPVMKKGGPFRSIEIDVDAVHAMGMEWGEIVRNFTKKWIAENSFQGPATVWDWFTESVSFDNEQRTTCFLVGHGFPRNFMTNLATSMRLVLNNAVRSPSDYLTPNRNDGWSPTVHVQDSKAWLKLDEITWREV